MRFVHLLGQLDYAIDGGSFQFFAKEFVHGRWDVDASGTMNGEIDGDADGIEEYLSITSPTKVSWWNVSPSTGAITRRVTQTPNADGTWRLVKEGTVNGVFMQTSDVTVPESQHQAACTTVSGSGPLMNAPCAQDPLPAFDAALSTGLACLRGAGGISSNSEIAEAVELFAQVYGRSAKIQCQEGGDSQAHVNNHEIADPNVPVTVYINNGTFTCPDNQVQGTIFHEVLHTIYLSHDPRHEISDIDDGLQWAYTDSMYACERFCFGTLQTKCSCAECLKVRTCDPRCDSYDSCVVYDDAGIATMSEAVGAVCDRRDAMGIPSGPPNKNGVPVAGQWYKTMNDCKTQCATGAGNCQSFSLSCRTSCQ
jgi:hypothetical protein